MATQFSEYTKVIIKLYTLGKVYGIWFLYKNTGSKLKSVFLSTKATTTKLTLNT